MYFDNEVELAILLTDFCLDSCRWRSGFEFKICSFKVISNSKKIIKTNNSAKIMRNNLVKLKYFEVPSKLLVSTSRKYEDRNSLKAPFFASNSLYVPTSDIVPSFKTTT